MLFYCKKSIEYNNPKSSRHLNIKLKVMMYAKLSWNRPADENRGNPQSLR